ncbi:MAG: DUF4340 domain-containing protein [Treponema sp.]|nr:DUF4340 domain-containing protein [Treponema sp.]
MNKRKIILAAIDLILAVVLICQVAFRTKEKVKIFTIDEDITKLEISSTSEDIVLNRFNALWHVNEQKYIGDPATCEGLVDLLQSIRVIDQVAKTDSDADLAKYNLQQGKAVVVKAYNGDKLLRTIYVGKNTSSQYQNYLKIDDGKEVYLAQGNFIDEFDTTVDRVRSHTVWDIDSFDITSIKQTSADGSVLVLSYNDGTWAIGGAEINLDTIKAETWANTFSTITAIHWLADTTVITAQPMYNYEIACGNKLITLDVYSVFDEEAGYDLYFGRSSESPSPFELSSYFIGKLPRTPEELASAE